MGRRRKDGDWIGLVAQLTDAGIRNGIFSTLCGYSGDAKQLADKHGIEIVN